MFVDTLSVPVRLSITLVLVSAFVGAALVAAFAIMDYVYPILDSLTQRLAQWARQQDNRFGRMIRNLVEPDRPKLLLLGALSAALIGGLWVFFAILEDVVTGEPLVVIDQIVYRLFSHLRTYEGDYFMVAMTELSDAVVVVTVAVSAIAGMVFLGSRRAAMYVAISFLGASLWVWLIKIILQRSRPVDLYHGASEFSFPSGHAAMSLSLYGFLAVLLAHDASPRFRRIVLCATLSVLVLISFSRIYLGAHWMSDVLAGIAFGIAWSAALAVLYYRMQPGPIASGRLAPLILAALLVVGAFHIIRSHASDLSRYAAAPLSGQTAPSK